MALTNFLDELVDHKEVASAGFVADRLVHLRDQTGQDSLGWRPNCLVNRLLSVVQE